MLSFTQVLLFVNPSLFALFQMCRCRLFGCKRRIFQKNSVLILALVLLGRGGFDGALNQIGADTFILFATAPPL